VVDGLDLRVAAGEVVSLLGANGAGKSTVLRGLAGVLRPSRGSVTLVGTKPRGPLHERARAGLAFVPEERAIISGLSTRDNLRLGRGPIAEALALFPELEPLLRRRAGLLSGGEQQMVVLSRALAAGPQVLLADEVSMGLAPLTVERLLQAVRAAADDRGVGVLLVEQHLGHALKVADRALVMRRGAIVMEGTAADLRDRIDEVESMYLTDGGVQA
jgi:branched-chain amino acid transport system ATP-binding protein